METVETAVATQLANIEKRTGKSLAELVELTELSEMNADVVKWVRAAFDAVG